MYNKSITLVLMLGLSVSVYAGNTYTDGGADHLWNNPLNWSMGVVPQDETTYPGDLAPPWNSDVYMTIDGTLCVIDDTHVGANAATAFGTLVGAHGGDNTLHILGGELRCGGWGFNVGRGKEEGSFGHVWMTGGSVSTPWLQVPEQHWGGGRVTSGPNQDTWPQQGEFIMTGGTITTGWFHVGEQKVDGSNVVNSIGHFYLHGGTVHSIGHFEMGPGGVLDITEGQLIINSDGSSVGIVQAYIDNGWITAYGGTGCLVLDDGRRNPGQITLTADTLVTGYDLDGNGTIGLGDLLMFSDNWLKSTPCICGGDFDGNDFVDIYDFAELGSVWEGGL
jgi:hypothetical protein